jgi:hypothetical protein
MRTTGKRLTQMTIAVGALVLGMAATPSFGKGNPALAIRAVAVHGNQVAITVTNHTARTRTGTVTSRVLVNGAPTLASAPVTAAPGETVRVEIVLPAPVNDGQMAGVVVDDGVPF